MGGVTQSWGYGALQDLKNHPKFKMPVPAKDENIVGFTCRCIIELISPAKVDGEDNELDCEKLSDAIWLFKNDIEKAWLNHVRINRKT